MNIRYLITSFLSLISISFLLLSCHSAEGTSTSISDAAISKLIPITINFKTSRLPFVKPKIITYILEDKEGKILNTKGKPLKLSRYNKLKGNSLKLSLTQKDFKKFKNRRKPYSFTIKAVMKGYEPINKSVEISALDRLEKTVNISLKPRVQRKIEYIPVALHFLNANQHEKNAEPLNIAPVRVKIFDKSGGLVYVDNTKVKSSVTLKHNFLSLKLPIEYLNSKGYSFIIEVEAKNFITRREMVTLTKLDVGGKYIPIYLLPDLNTPAGNNPALFPPGIVRNTRIFEYKKGGLTESVPLDNKNANDNNGFNVDINFPSGIKFADSNRKEYNSGQARGKIYTFDTRYDVARSAFPGGYLVTNAVQKIDNNSEEVKPIASPEKPIFLKVYGYITLDVDLVSGANETPRSVKNFTNGKIDIKTTFKQRRQPFKKPRQISLWYYDEERVRWVKEQTVPYNSGDREDTAVFQLDHLTTVMFGEEVGACAVPLDLTFSNEQSFRTRYVKMTYDGGTGHIFEGLLNFPGQGFYDMGVYVPIGKDIKTEILKGVYHDSGFLDDKSFSCVPVDTFLVPEQDPGPACEEIEIRINCPHIGCFHPHNQSLVFDLLDDDGENNYTGIITGGRINLDYSVLKDFNSLYCHIQYNDVTKFSFDVEVIEELDGTISLERLNPPTGGTLNIQPHVSVDCGHKTILEVNITDCSHTFPSGNIGVPCNG